MAYRLNIERIEHPLLRPLLQELIPVFSKLKISFFVVGATTRGIIAESLLFNQIIETNVISFREIKEGFELLLKELTRE